MTIKRRPYMTEPGEPLLFQRTVFNAPERFDQFTASTGLPTDTVLTSQLCSVPLPIYPVSGEQLADQIPTITPSMMWHPLMWLPGRVAGRYVIGFDDKDDELESNDAWAVRMCFELTASGMYDTETGTWTDVLALYGLDIDDAETQERVAAWLRGGEDDVLDNIDLTEYFRVDDDPDWAVASVLASIDTLIPASWAIIADDLVPTLEELAAAAGEVDDFDAISEMAAMIFTMAEDMLSGVPRDDDDGMDSAEYWANAIRASREWPNRDIGDFVERVIKPATVWVTQVRGTYWPSLEDEFDGLLSDPDEGRGALAGSTPDTQA